MTTGTKIFLALFALIVGVLVVYYGMVVPGNTPATGVTGAGGSNGDRVAANGDKTREPNAGALRNSTPAQPERRSSPPPREPAPTLTQTPPAATMPVSASSNGGLLSEGVREADGAGGGSSGGTPNMQVMPGGDGKTPSVANPYIPLIGLNSGNLRSSNDDSPKGDVEPVTPQGPQSQQPPVMPASKDPAKPSGNSSANPSAATQPTHVEPQPLEPMPERNPAPAPPPPPSSPSPSSSKPTNAAPPRTEYLIAQGDTFASIADDWFGDANKWSLIAKENPTVDPQKLKIGQKIYLPPKSAAITPAKSDPVVNAGETIYVVQSGDTLIAIARDHLGDGAKWESIYELNKSTIGPDSAALKVGMKIKLPKKS